ncbi:MAG: glutathione S-transferase C-terminal domain-containing protein, partial [Sinobacteraceae bacterium]|nr:glutathione S-transferase C-terminal domain-containing protein [Nevskiaceae bacterium]
PRDRYVAEARRLLQVIEQRLTGREWLMGAEFTIADIAIFPWIRGLTVFYGAGELVGLAGLPQVQATLARFLARPGVIRGLEIPRRS